jgi:hypothetical protein
MLNKYTALLIVLFILIIGYYFISRNNEAIINKKKKKPRKNSSRRKNSKKRIIQQEEDDDDDDEDDDSPTEDKNTNDDAEELYNLVHEPLCKGLQVDEFEEIVGDLAGPIVFIELKQLYNQCTEKNMDPMRTVTLQDYVRILKKEDGGE